MERRRRQIGLGFGKEGANRRTAAIDMLSYLMKDKGKFTSVPVGGFVKHKHGVIHL